MSLINLSVCVHFSHTFVCNAPINSTPTLLQYIFLTSNKVFIKTINVFHPVGWFLIIFIVSPLSLPPPIINYIKSLKIQKCRHTAHEDTIYRNETAFQQRPSTKKKKNNSFEIYKKNDCVLRSLIKKKDF